MYIVTAKTHTNTSIMHGTTILIEPSSSQVLGMLLYLSSNQTCKHKLQINKQENKRPTNIPTEVLILFLLIRVLVKVVDEGVGEAIVIGRGSPYYHDHNQDEAVQEMPEAISEPHLLPILCRVIGIFCCLLVFNIHVYGHLINEDTSLIRTPH